MKTYILLTGHSASGKDEFANHLKRKQNIKSINMSHAIDLLGIERGLITKEQIGKKETQQILGTKFRSEEGPNCFSKKVTEIIKEEKSYIINGIRAISELKYFKSNLESNEPNDPKNTKVILVALTADQKTRFLRRQKQDRAKTIEEFKLRDSHPAEKEIPELIQKADYTIKNNTNLEEFHQKIDQFIENNLNLS